MINLVWLVPLFPFIGFLIAGLGRHHLGKASGWIASLAVLASFVVSLGIFNEVQALPEDGDPQVIVHLFNLIDSGLMTIPFAFQVDALSSVFLLIITGIGFLIHLYSISYMSHDEGFGKFFAYLNLFVFSMLILVLGSNYAIMFIGWEGVGLCSYLLIGFWYQNKEYTDAAKKAFIMNRIGDFGFLMGIFLLFSAINTLDFSSMEQELLSGGRISSGYMTAMALCFFVGAIGKSAQIPLFTWLPDAMAGPTPVSALIHAATMVTAGVYMITRSHILYTLSPDAQQVILIVGAATAFIAATIATQQNDIKKVLAYSTVSQLGFMFMALGAGAYVAAVFHVITHAFFKALLFLGSGSVIHAMGGEQDIRHMGGLRKHMKITYLTFLIGCIAIAGIPPLSGFFSKDEIMMHVFTHPEGGRIIWFVGMMAALMTAYYMFRLLFVTFHGTFRGTTEQAHHLHESPALMTIPLIILALFSAFSGLIGLPELLGSPHLLEHFLEPVLSRSLIANPKILALTHSAEWILIGVAVSIAILGIVMAWIYYKKYDAAKQSTGVWRMAEDKWYIDEIYQAIIITPLQKGSALLERWVEKSGIDGMVNGVGKFIEASGNKIRLLQNGMVGFYLFMMVLGMILLVALQLWLT
jgi:NADH-quinone oxidoreductase subunit L